MKHVIFEIPINDLFFFPKLVIPGLIITYTTPKFSPCFATKERGYGIFFDLEI